jgi:hypothetical protein
LESGEREGREHEADHRSQKVEHVSVSVQTTPVLIENEGKAFVPQDLTKDNLHDESKFHRSPSDSEGKKPFSFELSTLDQES